MPHRALTDVLHGHGPHVRAGELIPDTYPDQFGEPVEVDFERLVELGSAEKVSPKDAKAEAKAAAEAQAAAEAEAAAEAKADADAQAAEAQAAAEAAEAEAQAAAEALAAAEAAAPPAE